MPTGSNMSTARAAGRRMCRARRSDRPGTAARAALGRGCRPPRVVTLRSRRGVGTGQSRTAPRTPRWPLTVRCPAPPTAGPAARHCVRPPPSPPRARVPERFACRSGPLGLPALDRDRPPTCPHRPSIQVVAADAELGLELTCRLALEPRPACSPPMSRCVTSPPRVGTMSSTASPRCCPCRPARGSCSTSPAAGAASTPRNGHRCMSESVRGRAGAADPDTTARRCWSPGPPVSGSATARSGASTSPAAATRCTSSSACPRASRCSAAASCWSPGRSCSRPGSPTPPRRSWRPGPTSGLDGLSARLHGYVRARPGHPSLAPRR